MESRYPTGGGRRIPVRFPATMERAQLSLSTPPPPVSMTSPGIPLGGGRHIPMPTQIPRHPMPTTIETPTTVDHIQFLREFLREMKLILLPAPQDKSNPNIPSLWCCWPQEEQVSEDDLLALYVKYMSKFEQGELEGKSIHEVFMALWFGFKISARDIFLLAAMYHAKEEFFKSPPSVISNAGQRLFFIERYTMALFMDGPLQNPILMLSGKKSTSLFERYICNVLTTDEKESEDFPQEESTLLEAVKRAIAEKSRLDPVSYSLKGQNYVATVNDGRVLLLESTCPTCSAVLCINMLEEEDDAPERQVSARGVMTIQKIRGLPEDRLRHRRPPSLGDFFGPQQFPFQPSADGLDDICLAYQRVSHAMNYNPVANAVLELFMQSFINGILLGPDLAHYQQLPLRELTFFFPGIWLVTFFALVIYGDKNIDELFVQKNRDLLNDCLQVFRAAREQDLKDAVDDMQEEEEED